MRPGESRVVDIVQSAADLHHHVSEARANGNKIGLVPTMGALHDGHLRLIGQCRAETEFVVVSIFVNPTQFAAGEDLNRYPRALEEDLRKANPPGPTWSSFPAFKRYTHME